MKNSKEGEEQKVKTLELALKDREDARDQTKSNGKDEKKDATVEPELSNNTQKQDVYCHYYNNFPSCDFERITSKKCKFKHQKSPTCRYGKICNRRKCI